MINWGALLKWNIIFFYKFSLFVIGFVKWWCIKCKHSLFPGSDAATLVVEIKLDCELKWVWRPWFRVCNFHNVQVIGLWEDTCIDMGRPCKLHLSWDSDAQPTMQFMWFKKVFAGIAESYSWTLRMHISVRIYQNVYWSYWNSSISLE